MGSVHEVGPGLPITSIQAAIALAAPGDTVLVNQGLYKEQNLLIDKSLSLIGKDWPQIDGEKKYEVISIKADSVLVTGFRIQNSGSSALEELGGIKVYDSRDVRIIHNTFQNNFFGIYIQYSRNCLIRDNHLTAVGRDEFQMGNGIHCWKSDSLQIIGNTITGHRDGIYFEFVTGSVIWRNMAINNVRYGLHFMFSHDDAYITNIFRGNGAGVAVMFTHNVKMFNNTFADNWGEASYGLLLKEITDSYLLANRFERNTVAILMEGSNRIMIERNVFKGNGWGMKILASCMDNQIRHNNFVRNTFDVSTNGSMVMNHFEMNYWDKYEGYDLNKDQLGDVPFRPLSLFSVIVERNPPVIFLYRSFIVTLIDRTEKIIPTLTPKKFLDNTPAMHPFEL
jgi:nitrous oxidase accessory protein